MAFRHFGRALAGLVLLVAAGFAQSAHAQNWDSAGQLRFGTFLQGSFVDQSIRQTTPANQVFRQSASPSAFGMGVSAGYDLRLGTFVIGAESDISFDHGRDKASGSNVDQVGVDYLATLRGRFGTLVRPDLLLYGTVGMAVLGAEYKLTSFSGGGGPNSTGNKKTASALGLAYGAGLEYQSSWGTWFAEYLHMDFDDWTFENFNGNQMRIETDSDVVRAGVKFKIGYDFGHGGYVDDVAARRYGPLK
ncbi:MAG: outer membrane protein [Hyphomicrobiaceae bacterium]